MKRKKMITLLVAGLFMLLAAAGAESAQRLSCADWNRRAFFAAAGVEDVRRCIAAGGNVNTPTGGWTLLHSAVTYGAKPEVVAALLDAGARLIPEGRSLVPEPLYMAASSAAEPEVLRLLVAAMAPYPPEEARKRLNAALHGAVYSNPNPAVVSTLIKAGADPNARVYGGTALHTAAETNAAPVIVRMLLDAGADLEGRDDSAETPLHKATLERNPLNWSRYGESPRVLSALLAAGADPNARDGAGDTPLHAALREMECVEYVDPGVIETLGKLLAAGADPNARGRHGWTPLMHAANTGFTILAPPLIKAGAKLNLRAADGATALIIADLNGHTEMVDMLIKAGADTSLEGP